MFRLWLKKALPFLVGIFIVVGALANIFSGGAGWARFLGVVFLLLLLVIFILVRNVSDE